MDDKKLSLLSQGVSAEYTLGLVRPFIDDAREKIVQRIKTLYLAGDVDGVKYIAAAAELCTLDTLEKSFINKIKTANRIREEK